MESKELSPLEQYCIYLVKKRRENCTYIQRAFTSSVFWMNSIKVSGNEIIYTQSPETIQENAVRLFTLSLSLAKQADSGNLSDLLKAVQQLFDEFSKYNLSETKMSQFLLRTNQPFLHSCQRVQYNVTLQKEKQKQVLHSLAVHSMALPEVDEIEIDKLSLKEPTTSFIKPSPIRLKKSSHHSVPFSALTIINLPYKLNLKEVVYELCEILKGLYSKFKEAANLGEETVRQVQRVDYAVKKYILYPLCAIINDAAGKIAKNQIDAVFDCDTYYAVCIS